jgi:hypothetical protein
MPDTTRRILIEAGARCDAGDSLRTLLDTLVAAELHLSDALCIADDDSEECIAAKQTLAEVVLDWSLKDREL